jgi:hypothetical protein
MTKMAEQYEGHFLCGMDLEKPVEVEISDIAQPGTEKDSAGKPIKEAILSFKGAKKRFILNKVNWRVIAAIHGKDETQWIGKKITLACRYLKEFMGYQNVQCTRVIPPKGTAVPMSVVKFMGKADPY